LRKLAENRASLGDWNLALAAYNMGLGAISRAVAASGSRDFWLLREKGFLSRETSSYVPKFLAVASILRYPGRNGLPLGWAAPVEWEGVELGRSVDLGLLAEAAKLSVNDLRSANAELRYAVTPPWKGYRLKVPSGSGIVVTAALADNSRKLLRYQLHTVRSGDSLSMLSRAYGAPVPLIVESNPGLEPDRIRIGQVIVVPVIKEGAAPPPVEVVADDTVFGGSYLVQKGDSLWGISLRFKVRPETLAERNGLELTSVIREGMSLSVPILVP
ncbi:MAG: LysM peptidoglycan-binding domain-containing protein, partial [Spirochaetota bacterium]